MKKLFTSDKFFLITAICAFVFGIAAAILSVIVWSLSILDLVVIIIRVSCGVVLFIAYKKHAKNVMKGMMGALLMAQLIGSILNLNIETFVGAEDIFAIILVVLTSSLFINHFVINSVHHSSPGKIRFNQIVTLLIVLNVLAWNIYGMIEVQTVLDTITNICDFIAYSSLVCVVVCVESRLDAYRLDREAAGWTEEDGYPEGYVHQKDKK